MRIQCFLFFLFCTLNLCFPPSSHSSIPNIPESWPQGYHIECMEDGNWQYSGFFSSDNLFRENALALSCKQTSQTKIRLTKSGNGAGNIDRVLLDGLPPRKITGVDDPRPLQKLAAKDFDVVHCPDAPAAIELIFPGGTGLILAGRVESERASEKPFRFPEGTSGFYAYEPSSKPFRLFSEGTDPGTGHPFGKTSATVRMEKDILHVNLDFESDNTLDGGEDYASLHIKTQDGIKTFTVTELDQRWGTSQFEYTPGVPWQHKVYDFNIPVGELTQNTNGALQLAFSAYGTAGIGPQSAVTAYGANNQEYLTAYLDFQVTNTDLTYQIKTQRFTSSGHPKGAALDLSLADTQNRQYPAIAYDPNHDRFLVIWVNINFPNPLRPVSGLFVSSNNTILGSATLPDFNASSGFYNAPALVFSPISNKYLLLWSDSLPSDMGDIKAQRLGWDGTLDGSSFTISAKPSRESDPRAAYQPGSDSFYIVWQDEGNPSTTQTDIWAKEITANGAISTYAQPISNAAGEQFHPDVAHDPDSGSCLVVWSDGDSQATQVTRGRFVVNGSPSGTEFLIGGAGTAFPHVGYAGEGKFLVVYRIPTNDGSTEIRGRWVDSSAEFIGDEVRFLYTDDTLYYAPDIPGDGKGSFLMVSFSSNVGQNYTQLHAVPVRAPWLSRILWLTLPAINHK